MRRTPASRQPVSLPSFTCQTTCFGLCLVLIEIVATAALFTLYSLSAIHRNIYITSAALSVTSIVGGVMGLCRSTPAALITLILSTAVTFLFVMLSCICILSTFNVRSAIDTYIDESLRIFTQKENDVLNHDVKVYLWLGAATLLVSALAHYFFVRHLNAVVGARRAAIAFLQTFSMIVLPFSLFLIMGGQYIADTATLASAPYTGIIIFACGLLLLAIAVLSFIGASFEYRRLLSASCMLSYCTGTLFVGLAVTYFALMGQIQDNILLHWKELRVILPPTFQARYDRDQFASLIKNNLKMVACLGIICGFFIFYEANVCLTLMHQATRVKRQLAHDKKSMRQFQMGAPSTVDERGRNVIKDNDTVSVDVDTSTQQRHHWMARFAISKRRHRIAMRIVSFLFVVAVALIFSVMCANIVFTTKCNSIGKLMESSTFPLFDDSTNGTVTERVWVTNLFKRGSVSVVPATNTTGGVALELYGKAEKNGDEDLYSQEAIDATMMLTARPVDVTRFLWLDGSCQRSVMDVAFPTQPPRQLTLRSNASADIRGSSRDSPLVVLGLDATTGQANINCSDILGHTGVATAATIYSALGPVQVTNATFVDCDVDIETGAGTIQLTSIDGTVSLGRSRLSAKSVSGGIFASYLDSNWIQLASEDGNIFALSLTTAGNSAFMGRLEVTTVAGDVELKHAEPSGNVHIETSSGNIYLHLKPLAFTGLYYVRSDYGNVTIRKGNYAYDSVNETALHSSTDYNERQGGINCDPTSSSCLSFGDLHLRSRLGDIEVVVGCDSYQC